MAIWTDHRLWNGWFSHQMARSNRHKRNEGSSPRRRSSKKSSCFGAETR
jgi:hypothetical protein